MENKKRSPNTIQKPNLQIAFERPEGRDQNIETQIELLAAN